MKIEVPSRTNRRYINDSRGHLDDIFQELIKDPKKKLNFQNTRIPNKLSNIFYNYYCSLILAKLSSPFLNSVESNIIHIEESISPIITSLQKYFRPSEIDIILEETKKLLKSSFTRSFFETPDIEYLKGNSRMKLTIQVI